MSVSSVMRSVVAFTIVALMVNVQTTSAAVQNIRVKKETVLRQHAGVCFRQVSKIMPVLDHWKHVIIIHLPEVPTEKLKPNIDCKEFRSESLCNKPVKIYGQLIDVQNFMIRYTRNLYQEVLSLIPVQRPRTTRTKRMWWGLAEASDMKVVDENIREVGSMVETVVNRLVKTPNDIFSVAKITNARLVKLVDILEEIFQRSQQLTSSMISWGRCVYILKGLTRCVKACHDYHNSRPLWVI